MQTILFVIPSLDYGGAARQLTLIAEGLPRDRFRPRVCILGGHAPLGEGTPGGRHRSGYIGVEKVRSTRRRSSPCAGWRPSFGPTWFTCGAAPPCAGAALGGVRGLGRLFVSAAAAPGRQAPWPDRWLLRRADAVVAFGEAEADRCRRLGVRARRRRRPRRAAGRGAGRGREHAAGPADFRRRAVAAAQGLPRRRLGLGHFALSLRGFASRAGRRRPRPAAPGAVRANGPGGTARDFHRTAARSGAVVARFGRGLGPQPRRRRRQRRPGGDGGRPTGDRHPAARPGRDRRRGRRPSLCRPATRRNWPGRPVSCSTTRIAVAPTARPAGDGRPNISPSKGWCGGVRSCMRESSEPEA